MYENRSLDAQDLLIWPNTVENFDEFVIDHECNRHIGTDTAEPRYGTLVESERDTRTLLVPIGSFRHLRSGSFVAHDLRGTVPCVLILRRFETLHARLDHIQRCIAEHTGRTSDETAQARDEQRHRCIVRLVGVTPTRHCKRV